MGTVTILPGLTKLPIPPDRVLEGALGKLDYVLVLGWQGEGGEKPGAMWTASSEGDMQRALWIATKFIHKLHAGDYY